MEDEMKHEELRRELDEVKAQLGSLSQQTANENMPRAMSSLFISSFHVFLGLIFLSLFFLSLVSKFNPIVTIAFFIASFLGLFPFLTDVFTKKNYASLRVLGAIILIILAGSYVLLWTKLLNPFSGLVFLVLSLLFFLIIIFFLIHAYFAYLKRIAKDEVKLLSLIAGVGFILFLIQLLYIHFLLITIYLIVIGLFLKGVIDLTQRFRT